MRRSILIATVATLAVAAGISWSSRASAQTLVCDEVDDDPCDIETFKGMGTGSYGSSFVSSNAGFEFSTANSCGGAYQIFDNTNLRKNLLLNDATSIINLPEASEYVTLLIEDFGTPARINILAYGSGSLVDEETRDATATDGAEAVKLGGAGISPLIDTIYVHYVEQSDCDLRCGTQNVRLAEIRACDVRAN